MSLGVRDAALPISPCASAFLQVAWPKLKADSLVALVEAYVQCHVEPLACVEDLVGTRAHGRRAHAARSRVRAV